MPCTGREGSTLNSRRMLLYIPRRRSLTRPELLRILDHIDDPEVVLHGDRWNRHVCALEHSSGVANLACCTSPETSGTALSLSSLRCAHSSAHRRTQAATSRTSWAWSARRRRLEVIGETRDCRHDQKHKAPLTCNAAHVLRPPPTTSFNFRSKVTCRLQPRCTRAPMSVEAAASSSTWQ